MKTLEEILDDLVETTGFTIRKMIATQSAESESLEPASKEAKQQILQWFEQRLPKKIDIKMNKYHHQTQIEGYNQAISDIRKALRNK